MTDLPDHHDADYAEDIANMIADDADEYDWDAEQPATATIRLPRPISTNNLFANVAGKGRVKSAPYNAWSWRVLAMMQEQRPLPRFANPVSVTLHVGESGVGRMDADNCAKAYLDALKTHGVIRDDSRKWVRSVTVSWVSGVSGCVAVVREEAGA